MEAQRGFDRLVNLSDAVVAIAATLLILPLVDIAAEIHSTDLASLVSEHWNELLAFLLSFAVICRFWLIHHAMFNQLVGFTRPIVGANFVWMGSIAFLPFPTELVSFSGVESYATALYIGTMCVASAATTAIQWFAIKTPAVQEAGIRGTLTMYGAVAGTLTLLVALVVAVVFPAVGLWALLLLFPSGLIAARLDRRSAANN